MACFSDGDRVIVHYRSVEPHAVVVKVLKDTGKCATSKFLVHETYTTKTGKKLDHKTAHFGSALRHAS